MLLLTRVTGSFDTVYYGAPTGRYSDGKRMMGKAQQHMSA